MGTGRLRVAIVGGAGMWGKNYLRAAAANERIEPILVDTSDRRQAFAEEHGVAESYATVDELRDLLKPHTPEWAEQVSGVPSDS